MKTLQHAPRDVTGNVPSLSRVTLSVGTEFYLGHPLGQLQAAVSSGEHFTAFAIIGQKPKLVIINPAHVVVIESLA